MRLLECTRKYGCLQGGTEKKSRAGDNANGLKKLDLKSIHTTATC